MASSTSLIPSISIPIPVSISRSEYITSIASLAHSYGFVPIPLKGKIPVAKGWTELRNNSEEDINDMISGKLPKNVRRVKDLSLSKLKTENVGIVTGEASGVVVIDIDTADNGVQKWNDLLNDNGLIPNTLIVQTPSGGYHYYFKYTSDMSHLGNINRILRMPFDYRTNNGMIVFPGSMNKEGLEYKVLSGYVDNKPVIAEMPKWLKTILVMDRVQKENKQIPTLENVAEKAKNLGIIL